MNWFNQRGGGGNNQQQNNQQQNNQQQNQQQNQNQNQNQNNNSGENNNNNQNNKPLQRNIWDDNSQQNNQQQQQNQNQNQNNNNQSNNVQQKTPEEMRREHLNGLNLTGNVDLSGFVDENGTLNTENVQKAFQQVAENTYSAALSTLNQAFESRLNKAVDDAVSKATGAVNSDLAIQEMNKQLPFTAEPDMKPIANAMLSAFVRKGMNVRDAINEVNTSLKEIAGAVLDTNPDFANSRSGGNRMGSSGFQNSGEPETNWLDLLGGNAG